MSLGIKVSKPGFDVGVADKGDLFLSTEYPLLKIKTFGTGTLSIPDGGGDSDTIAHNLGFVPKVFVSGQYYNIYDGAVTSAFVGYPVQQMALGVLHTLFTYSVDINNLVVSGEFDAGGSSTIEANYFYYIFYDEE